MTEFLRRSDAPHKSIRCCSLLSAPVTSCSCWGAGHCCRWWQEYVTKLVLCRVRALALSRLSGGEICLSGLEGTSVREQLRWRQSEPWFVSQRCSSLFWGCCCIFGEPRAGSALEGRGAGFCSSESHGAGEGLREWQCSGCVLRAWLGPWHCLVPLPEPISSAICMGKTYTCSAGEV